MSIWDPLISADDQINLNNLGVKVLSSKPEDAELVFLCVYHDEIIEFLKDYKGHIYDYRRLNSN